MVNQSISNWWLYIAGYIFEFQINLLQWCDEMNNNIVVMAGAEHKSVSTILQSLNASRFYFVVPILRRIYIMCFEQEWLLNIM